MNNPAINDTAVLSKIDQLVKEVEYLKSKNNQLQFILPKFYNHQRLLNRQIKELKQKVKTIENVKNVEQQQQHIDNIKKWVVPDKDLMEIARRQIAQLSKKKPKLKRISNLKPLQKKTNLKISKYQPIVNLI